LAEPITRIYANPQAAAHAVGVLKSNGFGDDLVKVVNPDAGRSVFITAKQIMATHVLRAHALVYAAGVQQGHSLVTVHAPWGRGTEVEDLLDGCNPLPSPVGPRSDRAKPYDDTAPLSSALHIPVLTKGAWRPFSKMWHLPLVTRNWSSFLFLPTTTSSTLYVTGALPLVTKGKGARG
jgi:hypothetical protein